MINLKIFELLSVIGIGISVMIIASYFIFSLKYLFEKNINDYFPFINWLKENLRWDKRYLGRITMLVFLIFTFGTITQEITDNLADSESSGNFFIKTLQNYDILKSEGELRKDALISGSKLTALGKDILSNKKITDPINNKSENKIFNTSNAESFWKEYSKNNKDDKENKELLRFIGDIYYTSKNWCFLISEPARSELTDIQVRIDLARSTLIISFFSILLLILLIILYFCCILFKKIKLTNFKQKICQFVLVMAVLVTIFFISRYSYYVTEKNFNERAMGYYRSHFLFLDDIPHDK